MPRYFKIKGKPGALVEGVDTPELGSGHTMPRRFVGKRAMANPPKGAHLVDTFEDVEQVVEDDVGHHIRRACKDGDLEKLGECKAASLVEAMALLNKPEPKPKGDKSGGSQ